MSDVARNDIWALGSAYELYVGRWSRRVTEAFGVYWLVRDQDRRHQTAATDSA